MFDMFTVYICLPDIDGHIAWNETNHPVEVRSILLRGFDQDNLKEFFANVWEIGSWTYVFKTKFGKLGADPILQAMPPSWPKTPSLKFMNSGHFKHDRDVHGETWRRLCTGLELGKTMLLCVQVRPSTRQGMVPSKFEKTADGKVCNLRTWNDLNDLKWLETVEESNSQNSVL